MSTHHESPAVEIARAHADAWSHHNFDTARRSLAAGIKVTATSTQPTMPSTSLTGVDDYMSGLVQFAQGVVPGSADVIASMVPGSGLAADEGGHRMRLEPVYSAGI